MRAVALTTEQAQDALGGLVHAATREDEQRGRGAFAAAAWSSIAEPGDGVAGHLVRSLGAWEALEFVRGAHTDDLLDPTGPGGQALRAGLARWRPRLGVETLLEIFPAARRSGIRLLVPGDAQWPESLEDLGVHAPHCLWVRGVPDTLQRRPSVAIVGARAATAYGEHVAMEFAADLAGSGVAIVSGAAYGIDGSAHRAALAAGGPTVAVLAGGVDRPYPTGHSHLLDRIAATGAAVSEVPCGAAPTKWRFLQRNRLIAALADATVVVEAGWRSGSLNTAGHAAALGRPLGAVPGPVTSAASAGCHRLLREFDARCVTTPDDVRELFGALMPAEGRTGDAETDDHTRILDALSVRVPRSAEDIARRAGMARGEVEALLALIELEGKTSRGPDGWRRVVPR
jgi:DNA processing protein